MNETWYVKVKSSNDGSYTFTVSENDTGTPIIDILTTTLPNGITAGIFYKGLEANVEAAGGTIELQDDETAFNLLKAVQYTLTVALNSLHR